MHKPRIAAYLTLHERNVISGMTSTHRFSTDPYRCRLHLDWIRQAYSSFTDDAKDDSSGRRQLPPPSSSLTGTSHLSRLHSSLELRWRRVSHVCPSMMYHVAERMLIPRGEPVIEISLVRQYAPPPWSHSVSFDTSVTQGLRIEPMSDFLPLPLS